MVHGRGQQSASNVTRRLGRPAAGIEPGLPMRVPPARRRSDPGADGDPETSALRIPARDEHPLAATLYGRPEGAPLVVINSATAVPRRYYRRFAQALVERGAAVLSYDYRGTGGSRPESLVGFQARMRDWVLLDMAGVLDWARARRPSRLVMVGHSVGGQLAGLLEDPSGVDAMLTVSSQSGYWALQGGEQKLLVGLHQHLTLPLLSQVFGYMPWARLGAGEDLPKGVALEWARWCRHPRYLLGDRSLPLGRFAGFTAPVLALSIDDDKWGTRDAVDAMMGAYPNVERRHLVPRAHGLPGLGHFGFFRSVARPLWGEIFDWLGV
jgi:predicted alpha/beta hydrolase